MTDCLSCPDAANYAAIATILQRTALEAEACIFSLEQRLRGAVNLPTVVQPASAGAVAANFRQPLSLSAATFANSAYTALSGALPRGVYQVGMFGVMSAVGVINDNSYRQLEIAVRNQFAPSGVPDNYNVLELSYEASSGNGTDIALHTVIESDGNDRVLFYMQHGNTSSNVQLTNGIAWATRLSDLDSPRVVG